MSDKLIWAQVMASSDNPFFAKLGRRIAALRKEINLTQVQLAEMLEISQQTMAHYEGARLKVPASMLPVLASIFGISVDELLQLNGKSTKRGPTSKLQRQIEQVSMMPRAKQKFVSEMLETVIKQQAG